MSITPNFNHYSLNELIDAQEHLDLEKYPERAETISRLIVKRQKEGDIQREITRSARYLKFKQWVLNRRFSRWLSKTFIGRFYRYLTQHHWGMEEHQSH